MSSRFSLSLLLLLSILFVSLFVSLPSVSAIDDDSDDSSESDIDIIDGDDEGGDIEVDTDFDVDPTESTRDEPQYNFMSHPDVSTSVYFPKYPTKAFEIGEEVTALVGFSNTGSKTFNLTFGGANLLSPEDGSYYIQNFSVVNIGQIVEPGHELTFEYKFKTAEQLEAAEYRLAAWVLYNGTEGGVFFNTYFNQTVEISEKNKGILHDIGRLITILGILGALGGGGYLAYNQATGGTKKKRKPRVAEGERKPAPVWEVEAYKPSTKQKTFGQKKRSQKKETGTVAQGERPVQQQEQQEE